MLEDHSAEFSLIQSTTAVSVIAVAMATYIKGEGPVIGTFHVLPDGFMLAGIIALLSAIMATDQVIQACKLGWLDIIDFRPGHQINKDGNEPIVVFAVGLVVLGLVYLVFMLVGVD